MKILFLDIDGVVNSAAFMKAEYERLGKGSLLGINPVQADMVKRIVRETGCSIVLSSSWRLSERGRNDVLRDVGEFIATTGRDAKGFRGNEVKRWLELNMLGQTFEYAILDDDSDFYKWQPLFKTTWEIGLTEEITQKVIDHFNA